MSARPWGLDDDRLRELVAASTAATFDAGVIAADLGRTPSAVRMRMSALGIPSPRPQGKPRSVVSFSDPTLYARLRECGDPGEVAKSIIAGYFAAQEAARVHDR
jgi:hypothetical protein